MPVDKFGRMSDTKTKDTGVSLTYINNNYVRNDGGTPISGSLDMRGNTIYNVTDPVNLAGPINEKDAVTKEYVDTTTVPFLKLDQTKYNTKGDIDMGGLYTVYNVKKPIDDSYIVDKKYVDEMDNLKSAFSLKSEGYEAKGVIYMKKKQIGRITRTYTR